MDIKHAGGFHINDMHSFDVNPFMGLLAVCAVPAIALGLLMLIAQ